MESTHPCELVTTSVTRYVESMAGYWCTGFFWVDEFPSVGGVFRGIVYSYNLIDLTTNVYFGDGFSVGVNISNLLNNKHYQYFGGDLLLRNAVATFSYRW